MPSYRSNTPENSGDYESIPEDNKKDQEIDLDKIINSFEEEYRPSELAKIISDQTGFPKSIIYNKIIKLKEDN